MVAKTLEQSPVYFEMRLGLERCDFVETAVACACTGT